MFAQHHLDTSDKSWCLKRLEYVNKIFYSIRFFCFYFQSDKTGLETKGLINLLSAFFCQIGGNASF